MTKKSLTEKIETHSDLQEAASKLYNEIKAELNTLMRRWLHILKDDPSEADLEIQCMIENLEAQGDYRTQVNHWYRVGQDDIHVSMLFAYNNEKTMKVFPSLLDDPEMFFSDIASAVSKRIAEREAKKQADKEAAVIRAVERKRDLLKVLADEFQVDLVPKQ